MADQTDVTPQAGVTEQTAPAQVAPADETLGTDGKPFDPARALALIEKLKEENKQLKPKAKLADELTAKEKAKADADLTEVEKLKNQLAEQEKTTRSTMAENAALAAGLPASFADRLKGSTKAELEADAAEFAKLIPAQGQKPAPKLNTTNPQNAQQAETFAQQKERLFPTTGKNIFDPVAAREHGGGVIE
jgi:hypothetical protein